VPTSMPPGQTERSRGGTAAASRSPNSRRE